jgi:hypothetical protein
MMKLPDMTKGVILLGDGDSDPHRTRAIMLTGSRRLQADGYAAWVHMAPDRHDFNSFAVKMATGVAA